MSRDWYRDCAECGSKCCKFFGVPVEYQHALRNDGVPLSLYRSCLEPNPERYFELHEHVNVSNGRFTVGDCVPTTVKDTPLGRYVIVQSKCRKLGKDGRCRIYAERPEMCRNFVARTAHKYLVPKGCVFDPGCLGKDYGV